MDSKVTQKDLFEIIRRQSEQIDQLIAQNKALQAENARLKKRIEELERRARKYTAPFSRETRTAQPKSPGRRSGEGPFAHKSPPTPQQVTETVQVATPNTCRRCGFTGPLIFTRHDKAWVTELAPQNAVQVTEYHVPVMDCPQCHAVVRGDHPALKADQVGATAHRLGPVLHATLQTLHHEVGLPVRRIGRVMELLTALPVTQSAITQAAQRLAADGHPLTAHVNALQADLQQAPFVHHDDTGWRVGTQNAWVGAFRSADTVLFRANLQHTNVELREGLGQNFAGVLICDRFSSYDSRFLVGVKQQKCLAHLIRNADEVAAGEQGRPGRGEVYGQRVAQVFRDGIRLHRDVTMGGCTREEYAQQGEGLTLRLDALLNRAPLKSKSNERLRLGILKQYVLDRLWRFLKDPDIPPTNNAAERSLRTVVMARKVSQCSKNAVGAQTYMRIKSTVETARLRGQDPVAVLINLIR
ncbi:IS66 family transposase [Deinococcus rubellus]|uniref:IS66 family transposase n=1 Tax=Deinococcus rubellus TaxID=1889240 RepID=A0ABY5YG25_9DEIO|nr:IS66 family transposase [Deinococcus rubellus]UWX64009.1 IS66 family transposase [Deinococcus rubellus]